MDINNEEEYIDAHIVVQKEMDIIRKNPDSAKAAIWALQAGIDKYEQDPTSFKKASGLGTKQSNLVIQILKGNMDATKDKSIGTGVMDLFSKAGRIKLEAASDYASEINHFSSSSSEDLFPM